MCGILIKYKQNAIVFIRGLSTRSQLSCDITSVPVSRCAGHVCKYFWHGQQSVHWVKGHLASVADVLGLPFKACSLVLLYSHFSHGLCPLLDRMGTALHESIVFAY